MKFIIVLSIILASALADNEDIQVLSQIQNVDYDGSYSYSYELSNGAAASESGVGGVTAQGQFRYNAPDGTPIALSYTADEDGFHPQGDHLPQPPEVPEQILRALEYIRTHPPKEQ